MNMWNTRINIIGEQMEDYEVSGSWTEILSGLFLQ